MNAYCGPLILFAYIVFGAAGIVLEYRLAKHTVGLANPIVEQNIQSARGRKLFHWIEYGGEVGSRSGLD